MENPMSMAMEQTHLPIALSSISREAVRALMRRGWDTMQIAKLFQTTEAAIWNALEGQGDESQ